MTRTTKIGRYPKPERRISFRGKIPGKPPPQWNTVTGDPAAPWGWKKDGTPRKKPGGGVENKDTALLCGVQKFPDRPPCRHTKGYRTTHPNYGPCYKHGGNLPTMQVGMARKRVRENMAFLGKPIEIDPHEAVIQDIHRTAGHIEYLRDYLDRMEAKKGEDMTLMQVTANGLDIAAAYKIYQEERKHLVNICKAAVGMGIAERQVQLAEDQGKLLAAVLQAFMGDPDLKLTPQQQSSARVVMKRHLSAIPAISHLVAPGKLPSELPPPVLLSDEEA